MELAGTLAQTYRIPRQAVTPVPSYGSQGGSSQFDDGLAFDKNLQEVEGQTSEYYHEVAALKSFMADVHANLGIDVRVPDINHPESIKLNRIYQKALAKIMHTGNRLKEGQTERNMHINRGDIYTPSARGKADSQLSQGADYYSQPLPQDITQINDLTQQPSYDDQSYQQKLEVYNKRKGELEEAIKTNPEQKQYLEYQLHGLTPPARAIKQFAPPRTSYQDRAAGRKMEAAGNILKEITNLKHGVADDFKVSKTLSNPNNPDDPLMTRPNFRDATYNGKHIKEWGHDPKSNESFLFFDDGSFEDVTKQDPLTIARVMMGSNKATFGIDSEYMDEWADKKGVLKDDGSIDQEKLLRQNANKVKEQNLKTYNKDVTAGQVANLGSFLEKIQEGTSWLVGTRSKGELKVDISPNPVVVKKAKGSGKLYISNFEDIFKRPSDKKKLAGWAATASIYGGNGDGVDAQDMRKFLQKYGAHLFLNKSTAQGGTQLDDAAKAKAQELIDKYRKQ